MNASTLRQIKQVLRSDPDGVARLLANDFAGISDDVKDFLANDATPFPVSFVSRTTRTVGGRRIVTLNLTIERPLLLGGSYPWTIQISEIELLARAFEAGRTVYNAADITDALMDHPLPSAAS